MRHRTLPLIALPLLLACGSSGNSSTSTSSGSGASSSASTTSGTQATTAASTGSTTATSSGTTTSTAAATGSSSSGSGSIPGAGSGDMVDNNFGNTMTDGTADTATPLGVSTSTMGLNVWVNGNMLGMNGQDDDYFVFESGPAAQQFTFDICFGSPITQMTATLWKVTGGKQVMPPVGTWTGTSATGCVTTSTPNMPAMLEASTEYLFDVHIAGGSGMYSA